MDNVMIAALDIHRVSANSVVNVVQYVGVVGLHTPDVLQELSLLHLLNRQPDGPVVAVCILKQILLPIEVRVRIFSGSILTVKSHITFTTYTTFSMNNFLSPCAHY